MRSLCFFLIFLTSFAAGHAAERAPNVLFISIDDLNDWLGCYGGHPQVKTPHIDALAKRGVRFSNAHCQAPICNPSRVSMFLGKLPSTTGMYFLGPNFRTVEPTKSDETFFQTFRRLGYFVSTRGKIFHGAADPSSFDHVEKATGWRRSEKKLHFTMPNSHPLWDWGQVDIPDRQQRDFQTAAWAADELPKLAENERPFFLAVGFHLPHVPIYASKKWFDLYPLDEIQLPETLKHDRDDLPEISKQLSMNPTAPRHDWMEQNDEWRHAVRAYLAANSFVDHLVGMLLESLSKSGVEEETIVVLWSDHGFHLGEKLRWAKRSLWEETTRVPLIFAGPKIVTNEACPAPVGLIDVFPTLLDLAGLPAREDAEGTSLLPLLENPNAKWDQPAICTFGPQNHSLRDQRFRYIVYADGSEELYDHDADPHEFENLLAVENPTDEVQSIVVRMRSWLPKTNVDPVPGSAGSDSPLYGEGSISLGEAMKRGEQRRKSK
ncbi:MAG: sulfatase [Rubripirellula sp.]